MVCVAVTKDRALAAAAIIAASCSAVLRTLTPIAQLQTVCSSQIQDTAHRKGIGRNTGVLIERTIVQTAPVINSAAS